MKDVKDKEQEIRTRDTDSVFKTKLKKGNWLVIYTSVGYPPSLERVTHLEFGNYFTEDNGFDQEEIYLLDSMQSGEHQFLDGDAISVVRI